MDRSRDAWRLSPGDAARVEAVERPDAGIDRQLLLRRAVRHVVAVRDAVAVGDNQRRPRIRLGFEQRLQRLRHLGAHRDARDIDVAIHVGDQAQILFPTVLPAAANFATAPSGVAFDRCPPVLE